MIHNKLNDVGKVMKLSSYIEVPGIPKIGPDFWPSRVAINMSLYYNVVFDFSAKEESRFDYKLHLNLRMARDLEYVFLNQYNQKIHDPLEWLNGLAPAPFYPRGNRFIHISDNSKSSASLDDLLASLE